ncbi:glycosyltransferase family 2 protein [Pseudarthrobacter phenanthrenivorans]|uniref:glycosyltransferase family 2 protein n=1 Tax=Pseudarthrobacter phenanthrenivorans TaxID=361575 RepID=UPI00344F462D
MTDHPLLNVLQWVLLIFFMIPLIEVVLALIGAAWAHFGYEKAPEKFSQLIIQITTVGKEPELVQRTIDTLRSYNLTMPYQIWVAIEPGHDPAYGNADKVIVVPASFRCKPVDKARALEYTRNLRTREHLDTADVKILFVDDDTLPSKKYVELAFAGDYDLCQGVTVPSRWYAVGGMKHIILSHLDNIRTRNCLIYCSCTQGVTQKPLFVHGEGLCITGRTEKIVTWNRPIIASDDLVFGTNAAHLGMSWGYFHAAIQLVSPWSFKENLNQRWRWTWGNFDAIGHREIMPKAAAIFKGTKYAFGFMSIIASASGAVLLLMGIAKVPPQAHTVFWSSLIAWFVSYGFTGWINSGGEPNRSLRPSPARYWGFRVLQVILATLLTPVTALAPVFIISYSVLRGRPNKFIMIQKTNKVMQRTA